MENTFHYHVTTTIDLAKLGSMAARYIAWWTANVGLYSNDVGLELVYVRDLTTASGATLDLAPTTTTDGTRTSNMLPNNVSFAIKRGTGLAGRANRGRIYWVGITEDMQSGKNTMKIATAGGLSAALNTLLSDMNASESAIEVILHRHLGTGTPVVAYTAADLNLDAMRRRLPGHNRHH